MGGLASVALRALAPVAIVLAASAAACGDITLAPDAGPTGPSAPLIRDAGPPAPPGSVTPDRARTVGPGGTMCASNGDCPGGKLKRCDVARGMCVACLTNDDCDGDRVCAAGSCAGGGKS